MELIKSRRQVESSPEGQSVRRSLASPSQTKTTLRSLISEGSLFRGLWATILRDAPVGHCCPCDFLADHDSRLLISVEGRQAFGVYFSSYQYTLDALEGKTLSVMLNHLLAGGVAGSASWVVVVRLLSASFAPSPLLLSEF